MRVNGAAVLRAPVVALPVERGGVDAVEEHVQQLPVRHLQGDRGRHTSCQSRGKEATSSGTTNRTRAR